MATIFWCGEIFCSSRDFRETEHILHCVDFNMRLLPVYNFFVQLTLAFAEHEPATIYHTPLSTA
jgi:hypothetical protein